MATRKTPAREAISVAMSYAKATKNKYVYQTDDEETSFYLPKTWIDGDAPESITVTIEV